MAVYFFTKPYKRQEVEKVLEKIGLQKSKKDHHSYELSLDGSIWINFTDLKEARFQIQGNYIQDIHKKGRKSKYFSTLEKLSEALKPHKITNDGCEDIFSELIKK